MNVFKPMLLFGPFDSIKKLQTVEYNPKEIMIMAD